MASSKITLVESVVLVLSCSSYIFIRSDEPNPNEGCNKVVECWDNNSTSEACQKDEQSLDCGNDKLQAMDLCLDLFECRYLRKLHCEVEEIIETTVFETSCKKWGLEHAHEEKQILIEFNTFYEALLKGEATMKDVNDYIPSLKSRQRG